jgi:hypothetical protein
VPVSVAGGVPSVAPDARFDMTPKLIQYFKTAAPAVLCEPVVA